MEEGRANFGTYKRRCFKRGHPVPCMPERLRERDRLRGAFDRQEAQEGCRGESEQRRSRTACLKTANPEATEDDRDKRTIIVQQIAQRVETRHLHAFFEVISIVVEAQIVKNRVTLYRRRSDTSEVFVPGDVPPCHLRLIFLGKRRTTF